MSSNMNKHRIGETERFNFQNQTKVLDQTLVIGTDRYKSSLIFNCIECSSDHREC